MTAWPTRLLKHLRRPKSPADLPVVDQMGLAATFAEASDYAAALAIWGPLAQAGVPRAQSNVGACFAYGHGVQIDPALALRWMTLAADAGDPVGQRNLATLHYEGRGVEKDCVIAANWYRAAAEQGDAEAQDMLSWMLLDGDMLPPDPAEALRWTQAAAEAGSAGAAARLGMIHHNAMGTPRDSGQAVRWWRQAAEAGDPDGAAMLGAAYHLGQGVEADQGEAMAYLVLAERRGSQLAAPFLTAVRARLSETERAYAARRGGGLRGGAVIVGTAGHVDHGKTRLIRALTGIDTDRLKEEKARGITIDLGFAYVPDGRGGIIGFVDVPGHERLVHTMLAGAAGIDFAMLVIAADDGVMPQTREHLQILDLLGLTRGLVVLSKADLADATRRAELVAEIRAACAETALGGFDILAVSSLTGEGLDPLRARLLDEAAVAAGQPSDAPFRFSVDRVFSLTGAGTVVTGTIVSGRIGIEDVVTVLPHGGRARVRSLHVSNRGARVGVVGERCALNLAGADLAKQALARGSWLVEPTRASQTLRFDAAIAVLNTEPRPLGQWTPVHVHCGASGTIGRVVLLGNESLRPGEQGFVQIVIPAPWPLRHGDRVVLRDMSATRTIGGGRVLDPRAPARGRRAPPRLARLAILAGDEARAALAGLLALDPGFENLIAFAEDWSLSIEATDGLVRALDLRMIAVGQARIAAAAPRWHALVEAIETVLAAFHRENPDLPGMAIEHVRQALPFGLGRPLFDAVAATLVREGRLGMQAHWLRLPTHSARLGPEDMRLWDRIKPLVGAAPYKPPRVRDLGVALGVSEPTVRRTCKSLVRMGELTEIAQDHFFARAVVAEMAGIAASLSTPETPDFSASAFRDKLDNGRKVAIQILEFFDRQGLTLRRGDLRRVVKSPALVFGAPV